MESIKMSNNYIDRIQFNTNKNVFEIEHRKNKPRKGIDTLLLLEKECHGNGAEKRIKIGIAAHEIFNRYTKKSQSFWAKIVYGIKKIFNKHHAIATQNKAVNEAYQRIMALVQDGYTAHLISSPAPAPAPAPEPSPAPAPEPSPIAQLANDVHLLANNTFQTSQEPKQVAATLDQLDSLLKQQEVQVRITAKRKEFNDQAFKRLLTELHSELIPESFTDALRQSWESDQEDNLIPLNVKQHQQLFSKQLRQQILQAAKEASKNFDKEKINEGLDELRKHIQADLSTGRIIPAQTVIQNKYKTFFAVLQKAQEGTNFSLEELKEWKQQYNEIINQAYLKHECQLRSKNLNKNNSAALESLLIQTLGLGSLDDIAFRQKQNLASLEIVKTFMQAKGLDKIEIDELRKLIGQEQQKNRLKVAGVAEPEMAIALINGLEENREILEKQSLKYLESQKDLLDVELPPNARKHRFASKERHLKLKIQRKVAALLESKQRQRILNFFSKQITLADITDKILTLKPATILEGVNKLHNNDIYSKWSQNLIMEFKQGAGDKNEIFHEGICMGISSRWASEELKNVDNPFNEQWIKDKKIDRIVPEDRFAQATNHMALDQSPAYSGLLDGVNKRLISPEFRRRFNFAPQKYEPQNIPLKTLNTNIDLYKNCPNIDFGYRISPIYLVLTKEHAIYMYCDQQKGIFRIGDPNFGIFTFNDKKLEQNRAEFFQCLIDLINYYDGKKTDASCMFFPMKLDKTTSNNPSGLIVMSDK